MSFSRDFSSTAPFLGMNGIICVRSQRCSAQLARGVTSVDYDDSPEEADFRTNLRVWLEDNRPDPPPPLWETAATHEYKTKWLSKLYDGGWVGLSWPVEYGGQARGPIDQMIFVEESHWAGVPLPLLTLNSVGPTLMSLGTEEQKTRILPGILQGKVHFSIGYSEPSAGTDLASLKTRAVRDGDHQYPQRSSFQFFDGLSLRQGFRLRRDGGDG